MRRPSILLISSALLLFLIVRVSSGAGAQDQPARKVRVKKVGVTREEKGSAEQVNLWAVLIGVSRYQYGDQDIDGNYIRNLRYADADAQALYDFLSSPEGGGFRDEKEGGHMILLKDEEATKANVESALLKLKQTKPNDYFVIFIAAHGLLVPVTDPATKNTDEIPYFVLYDTDPRDFENRGIRMEFLRDLVREIPAKKGLVLADTCNSAGVQLSGRATPANTRVNDRYNDMIDSIDTGIGFISSAGPLEQAQEPRDLGHGAFTFCLLDGLRGNADGFAKDKDGKEQPPDGAVTFYEIAEYLRSEVPRLTNDAQHPHYKMDSLGAIDLPLAVAVGYGPESSASQYGTLVIRTPDIDGVEVSIDGSYYDKLDARLHRSVRVKAGRRKLTFTKGAMKKEVAAEVAPLRSKYVEVNLTFSQGDEDDLVDPTTKQLNVYLTDPKEPSKEARDLFHKGVDGFNKQKFQAAADLFNRAIQANGAYADALVYLGRAQQSLGRHKEAVNSFNSALALRPSDHQAETLLAEAQLMAGDNVVDVISRLKSIIQRHPNYEYARVVYGDVLLSRGEYIAAEKQLIRAIEIRPKSPPAHMILAQAMTYQQSKAKQKKAVESAEKALQLFEELSRKQTSHSRALRRLSISHVIFGGGRYVNYAAMAEAQYVLGYSLINLVSVDDSLADREVRISHARKAIDEAMKLAQKVSNKGRLALALDASAQLYLLQGDSASAIKEGKWALSMSVSPDLKCEVHQTLSMAYKDAQKFGKAAEHLKQYLDLCGSQLSPKERSQLQAEYELLIREMEANR